MHKYQRIFWLDDNPGLIGMLAEIAVQDYDVPSVDALLSRVTFAYDAEEGERIVSHQSFDLYVLDADFPINMPRDRRDYVHQFMQEARADKGNWMDFERDYGYANNTVNGDEFEQFHERCLRGITGKIVIYSSSLIAIHTARKLGLSFYSKGKSSEDVRGWLAHFAKIEGSGLTADGWEHGGIDELIERYILP